MAKYEYRCPQDGNFEVTYPIGTAAAQTNCVVCGDHADRVFSTPMLARTPQSLTRAIDHAQRSAERPEVVRRVPPRSQPVRRQPRHPGHARLPRP
ncbi:zinc ribbon domain-containing protein [Micromonospora sp. NPDC003197]